MKHIDCDWLIAIRKGVYFCCDSRSPKKGKDLSGSDVIEEACSLFHKRSKRHPLLDEQYVKAPLKQEQENE